MTRFTLKRVYDDPDASDGRRVLVDRLWPRGMTKEAAAIDAWAKDAAPSDGLRKWYHAGEGTFEQFAERYRAELAALGDDAFEPFGSDGQVTLVYAAKDEQQNHAVVLADFLRGRA